MSNQAVAVNEGTTKSSFLALMQPLEDGTALRRAEILLEPAEPSRITDLARESFQSSAALREYRENIQSVQAELEKSLSSARSDLNAAQRRLKNTVAWVKDYYFKAKPAESLSKEVSEALAQPLRGEKVSDEDVNRVLTWLANYVKAAVISYQLAPLEPATKEYIDNRQRKIGREESIEVIKDLKAIIAEHQFLNRIETLGMYLPWIAGLEEDRCGRELLSALDGVPSRNSKKGFLKRALAETVAIINSSKKNIEILNNRLESIGTGTSIWQEALKPVESELIAKEQIEREKAQQIAREQEARDLLLRRQGVASECRYYLRQGDRSQEIRPNYEIEDAYQNVDDLHRRKIIDQIYPLLKESTVASGFFKIFFEPKPDASLAELMRNFLEVELQELSSSLLVPVDYKLAKTRIAYLLPRVPEAQRKQMEGQFELSSISAIYGNEFIAMLCAKNPRILSWEEAAAAAEL